MILTPQQHHKNGEPQGDFHPAIAAESGDKIKPIWPEWHLWHHRERQIIPIAAGVTHLVVVAADGHRRPVGQVIERAHSRSRGCVVDGL